MPEIQLQKYVSIHSCDRDVTKYPDAASFEIQLPDDYLNVTCIKLNAWSFPDKSVHSVFSNRNGNITLQFNIIQSFYEINSDVNDILNDHAPVTFQITIESGIYNPQQLVTELTNRMNSAVTLFLLEKNSSVTYDEFIVIHNNVSGKIWFGNKSANFSLDGQNQSNQMTQCNDKQFKQYSQWGIGYNLGMKRDKIAYSIQQTNIDQTRFYYGDAAYADDNGIWLPMPTTNNGKAFFFECPSKLNIEGDSVFYMELTGLNTMDETMPFELNNYTNTTNGTNGIIKSSFVKIPITIHPCQQQQHTIDSYKWFNPPLDRIRKIGIKFRYHDNRLVDFDDFEYSVTLEFTLTLTQNTPPEIPWFMKK